VAFLWLIARPGLGRALLYGTLALVGLYTQPYSFLVPLAHLAWLVLFARERGSRALLFAGSANVLSGLLFLPWMQFATSHWRAEIASYSAQGGFGMKEVQLIVKELVGLGYLGTVLILVPAFLGWRALDREKRGLWALMVAIPILGAICGNLAFGYFFASRQFIAVLVPLTLLSALGLERARWRLPAWGWAAVLVAAALYGDVRWLRRPKEDWKMAAERLADLTRNGFSSCFIPTPERSLEIYLYFQPELKDSVCEAPLEGMRTVFVAYSPYESADSYRSTRTRLAAKGWLMSSESTFDGPKLLLFKRE
jgi:hypothetical protein